MSNGDPPVYELPVTREALKQMLDTVFAGDPGLAYVLIGFSSPGAVLAAGDPVTNETDNSVLITALQNQISALESQATKKAPADP